MDGLFGSRPGALEEAVLYFYYIKGAKVDWDFQISDLVKNPDGTDVQPLWQISVTSGGPS